MMIKNIIFDVGNVLLNFTPKKYLDDRYDEETSKKLFDIIFDSNEWQLLDHGKITKCEFIEILCKRNKDFTNLHNEITKILNDMTEYILIPKEENFKLLVDLKNRGYKIYILSNFIDEYFTEVEKKHEIFNMVHGKVVSSRVQMMKPNEDIFQHLLKTFDLKANECLFIDDSLPNIETSKRLGFSFVHYKGLEDNKEIEEILKN